MHGASSSVSGWCVIFISIQSRVPRLSLRLAFVSLGAVSAHVSVLGSAHLVLTPNRSARFQLPTLTGRLL